MRRRLFAFVTPLVPLAVVTMSVTPASAVEQEKGGDSGTIEDALGYVLTVGLFRNLLRRG